MKKILIISAIVIAIAAILWYYKRKKTSAKKPIASPENLAQNQIQITPIEYNSIGTKA
jgi:flagellar basal body-associated protein FliL